MFDKLKKILEAGIAQVNPFDQGKTYSTVMRGVQPKRPPAQIPSPGRGPTLMQRAQDVSRVIVDASPLKPLTDVINRLNDIQRQTGQDFTKFKNVKLPTADWSQHTNNPVSKFALSIPEAVLNAPNQIAQGGQNYARNLLSQGTNHPDNLQQAVGSIAQGLGGVYNIASLAAAPASIAATAAKNTLGRKLLQGGLTASKFTAPYAALQSLFENQDKSLAGQFGRAAIDTAVQSAIAFPVGVAATGVGVAGSKLARQVADDLKPGGLLRSQKGHLEFPGSDKLTPDQYRAEVKSRLAKEADDFFANEAQYRNAAKRRDAGNVVSSSKRMFTEFRKDPDAFIDKYKLLPADKTAPVKIETFSGSNTGFSSPDKEFAQQFGKTVKRSIDPGDVLDTRNPQHLSQLRNLIPEVDQMIARSDNGLPNHSVKGEQDALILAAKKLGFKHIALSETDAVTKFNGRSVISYADTAAKIAPSATANTAYKQTVKNGGVTISLEGKQPSKGIAYSPYKDTEFIVDKTKFTPETVSGYLQAHADKLNQPGHHLGVWEDGGKIYLDISKVGDLNSKTLQEAISAKQLAAFDLGKFEEIPLGKFGKTGYTPLYEAANHPYLNKGQVARAGTSGTGKQPGEIRPVEAAGKTAGKATGLTPKELEMGAALGMTPEQTAAAKLALEGPPSVAAPKTVPAGKVEARPKPQTTKTVRSALAVLSPGKVNEKPTRVEVSGRPIQDSRIRSLMEDLSRGLKTSKVEEDLAAASIEQKAKSLGVEPDMDFIDRYQQGRLRGDAEKALGNFIKGITDKTFKVQETLTPEVQYRKNFIPQRYRQDNMTVADAVQKLQTSTSSGLGRKFRTYAEASEFGLTPKFTNAAQMVGRNVGETTRAKANKDLIARGIKEGIFDTSPQGGWSPIEGFFDNSGDQVYAQKSVADMINGNLQKGTRLVDKFFQTTHKIAGGQQDIALAGGYKHYNFFTLSQAVRDATRTVGTALTGRPWQATKQAVHIFTDFGRAGTPDRAQKHFLKNADFIKDLVKAGLPIDFQTSLTNAEKGLAGRGWSKLFHNATFSRYMPLRMLSTAQDIYATAIKQKIPHAEAIKLAANNTRQFMGLVDTVAKGRSNLTDDIFGTAAFAPKYREGIINSLTRAVQSVVDPRTYGDKSFRASRELAIGMIATFIGMDQLNRKINGHGSLQNRKGQELSLQIPYGEKDEKGNQQVINIPYMPGYATIPRAVFEMIRAGKEGDDKAFTAAASKLASMPLQTAGRIYGNEDYFGTPIYTSKKVAQEEGLDQADDAATAARKIGLYVAGQVMPSYGRGVTAVAQGKPVIQGIAQAAEAPVRFGKVTNRETTVYFDEKEAAYNKLNPNRKATFDSIFPKTKNAVGEEIKDTSPGDRIEKSTALRNNPEVFAAVAEWQKNVRDKTGQTIDPIYDLPWAQAQNVLWVRSFAPGESGDTKSELLYNQPWYPGFKDKERAYYDALEKKLGKKDDPYNYPKETAQINKLEEAYYKLPKGTGQRSDFIDANPALTKFWDARTAAQNRHRAALGLPPIEKFKFGGDSGSQFGYGSSTSKRAKKPFQAPQNPISGVTALQNLLKSGKVSVKAGRRISAKKVSLRKSKV